ncbi:MAG: HhH-GPD-type base excision DNA repair protein [Jatrophihabitantaceae bacterium]
MYLASSPEANELLDRDPFALLIGMVLDQQIPLEKAFTSPQVLRERLGGTLDVHAIAEHDAQDLGEIFRVPPALHRFPVAMSKRVQELARMIVERYDADPAAVWTGATSGTQLRERIAALPGFGEQKARIFTALLGKQFGVRPRGWRQAAGDFGLDGARRSVADIVDATTLREVRAYKKQLKAAAQGS